MLGWGDEIRKAWFRLYMPNEERMQIAAALPCEGVEADPSLAVRAR